MESLARAVDEKKKARLLQKIDHLRSLSKERGSGIEYMPAAAIPSDGIQCECCGNTGYVHTGSDDGYETVMPCPHCHEQRMTARRLKQSGVSPEDYARYTLASFRGMDDLSSRMKDLAVEYLDNRKRGQGFGLFGSSGSGKTHLCIAVCQEMTQRDHEPHYYFSYRSEMPELTKSLKNYADKYDDAIKRWKTLPNLYIDDLFKLSGRLDGTGRLIGIDQTDLQVMFDIINARYLNHLTTLFSSEYSVRDMSAVDAALGSRIFEMVRPYALKVEGENKRLLGA